MDLQIALLLAQDGLTNGAVYALLALALVLACAVTRVIFIAQGEFVAYGALTLVALQTGRVPGTVWLLLACGALVTLLDGVAAVRAREARRATAVFALNLLYPLALLVILLQWSMAAAPMPVQIAMALALVVPLGPMIYRLAYQPLADAPVLILLIVSVAVHVVLVGLGLPLFGAECARTAPFSQGTFSAGGIVLSAQTIWVIGCSGLLMIV